MGHAVVVAGLRIVVLTGCALLTGCGGGDTRVCFSTGGNFCEGTFGANRAPEADAGSNQTVAGGARVTLDGSDSRDPDGSIASYSWSQQSGPPVALSQATGSQAAFDAPAVTQPASLVFRLVVTDAEGASDSDNVTVSVTPAPAAALAEAMRWLDDHPPPPCDESAAAHCWSDLGLWLGARTLGAGALGGTDTTALLDRLRVIEILHVGVPPTSLAPAARRLFTLGQGEVAQFTAELDPATAERAQVHATAMAPQAGDWLAAVRDPSARALTARNRVAHAALLDGLRVRGPTAQASTH